MTQLNRRNFIKTTLIASASLTRVAVALEDYVGVGATEIEDVLTGRVTDDPEFHLIDNNLLNIHFYFLNAKKKRRHLTPAYPDRASYMIVRLPQQHVSEAGFWQENWTDHKNNKPFAMLSGFSYLAFRIWPTAKAAGEKRKLPFTLETLLDWNRDNTFQLITLIDWLELKKAGDSFIFADLVRNCQDFRDRKIWNKKSWPPTMPLHVEASEPQSDIFQRYEAIVRKLFDANANAKESSFTPVTFFEIPHEVCLVPVLRKQTDQRESNTIKARFWPNKLSPKPSRKPSTRKYEIWNNTLLYERTKLADVNSQGSKKQAFVFETPSFRIAGLITDRDAGCPTGQKPCSSQECSNNPNQPDKIHDILPTLLDKTELAYLTQFASNENRNDPEFDIKELNGFFFTGLGVITHLKYDTKKNLPPGIDLIEYEHRITQGRDIFIKVARLGYNSKTGQQYKHVIEGKRKISTDRTGKDDPPLASFLELKQYCECIEPELDYTNFINGGDWNAQQFICYKRSTHKINEPVVSNSCHYRRSAFRSVKNTDKQRTPISCLQDEIKKPDACTLEQLPWFWVIREGPHKNPGGAIIQDSEVPIERYVPCHYTAIDWDGVPHEAATPFMFIRKCYVEGIASNPTAADAAYDNYLKGQYSTQNPRDPLIERRLTYFNGEKLAFTTAPTPPDPKLFADGNIPAYDSKTNILETEYFESYFNIKNTDWHDDPDAGKSFGEKRYVVFPQVLRARVFLDHIRDIAQTKIPSIIEFHPDYIQAGFDDYLSGTKLKNYGKLILKHTQAYQIGSEEPINNTYDTIKTALQQAKNRLGNLAVPDIVPDAISLDQSGITLPPNMTEAIDKGRATFDDVKNRLEALSPRALLRGKLSEILGGIDLTAILDELLPQADSPLFELKKLTNELEHIEQAVLNSAVYKEILQDVADLKTIIDKAVAEVNGLLAKIKDAQRSVNNALHNISSEIPNVDELESIVKNLFERYRTRAFEVLLENAAFGDVGQLIQDAKTRVDRFLAQELAIVKLECQSRLGELKTFFDQVKPDLSKLPAELKLIGGKDPQTYFTEQITYLYDLVVNGVKDSGGTIKPFNNYQQKISNLFQTVADNVAITVGSTAVLYKIRQPSSAMRIDGYTRPVTAVIEWELTDKAGNDTKPLFDLSGGPAGYVQLKKKAEDFRTLVAANLQSANDFQKKAVTELLKLLKAHEDALIGVQTDVESFQNDLLEPISKNIREWNDKAEAFRQAENPPAAKDVVKRVQELVLKGNSYVDFLRKTDPYFYYREQERLKKDIQDTKRRFFGALATVYGPLEEFDSCPDMTGHDCPSPQAFTSITEEVRQCICTYECVRQKLFLYATDPSKSELLKDYVADFNTKVKRPLDDIKGTVIGKIQSDPNYQKLKAAYDEVQVATSHIAEYQKLYEQSYKAYLQLVTSQAKDLSNELTRRVELYIDKKEAELIKAIDPAVIHDLQAGINEARNVYKALTAIKQQDLTYKWSTSKFHDVNLGILTFKKGSDPDTKLAVDVKLTTHFSPGKFPPAIERVETLSSNRLTNFGVGFFNVLTVSFSEVSFLAQSGQSPHFAVKIKDVKFDGAFSFVQEFEKWMAGKGLILRVDSDRLSLGYSLALPGIQTPAFSFFNITLNFDIRLYFDNRPMRFGFSFARPDLKFGIAAGIYAGFGFFGLVGEPKRGIVEMDAALEAGAWKGISIGPITGEVKLAFGFRYTRNDAGVRLEGYIVAEGRLSVWIIEVSARIYLGVVSENSYVEGQCTVTYSAKLGFVSKSFSGTFHQKIAGAQSKNQDENARKLLSYHQTLAAFMDLSRITVSSHNLYLGYLAVLNEAQSNPITEPETSPVSRTSWKRFAQIM
jgi:hypothetical protein